MDTGGTGGRIVLGLVDERAVERLAEGAHVRREVPARKSAGRGADESEIKGV